MPNFFSNTIYILKLISSLICKFFSDLFAWIIIDKFSPNYLPLCFIFEEVCYFIVEAIKSKQFNKFQTMGWDIYIRFFLYIILFIVTMIHNEIIIINICGISSEAKYFMDLKVEIEEIYSITDDPEILKKYETIEEEVENKANELKGIKEKNEEGK